MSYEDFLEEQDKITQISDFVLDSGFLKQIVDDAYAYIDMGNKLIKIGVAYAITANNPKEFLDENNKLSDDPQKLLDESNKLVLQGQSLKDKGYKMMKMVQVCECKDIKDGN